MKLLKSILIIFAFFLALLTLAPQEVIAAPAGKFYCSSALSKTFSPSFSGRLKARITSQPEEPTDSTEKVLTPSQGRLKGEWNRLNGMDSEDRQALKKQAARGVRESMAVLSEKGVAYEVDPENPLILLITVPASKKEASHIFNRLAFSLSRNMRIKIDGQIVGKPLRIEINPLMLKTNNAGALFDENLARLTLANDNVMTGEIDDMVVHELRHAYDFYAQGNGLDHDFTAYVTYGEKLPPIHETYPHSFSVDELAAYIKQIVTQLRMAKRDPDVAANALDFAKTGLILTQAMTRPAVSSGLLSQLRALRQSPKDWAPPHWAEVKIEDEMQKVWVYNHTQSGARIYFYETALLEGQKTEVPLTISHAVIEHGDYKIDMNTLMPLTPENMNLMMQKVESKIVSLIKRGDQIEKGLKDTIEALERTESPDVPKALTAISSAMSAIKIKD